jgi:hypothetical protein
MTPEKRFLLWVITLNCSPCPTWRHSQKNSASGRRVETGL